MEEKTVVEVVKEPKDGYKTTEFWLTAGAQITGLLLLSGVVEPGTGFDKLIGIVIQVFTILGYQVSRGMAKKQ